MTVDEIYDGIEAEVSILEDQDKKEENKAKWDLLEEKLEEKRKLVDKYVADQLAK